VDGLYPAHTGEEALTLTLEKVYEMPEMKKITGGKFAPKLGGKEFDDG
jgi:formylmethanofuran:tetrahydromethanopterin formyltransferase